MRKVIVCLLLILILVMFIGCNKVGSVTNFDNASNSISEQTDTNTADQNNGQTNTPVDTALEILGTTGKPLFAPISDVYPYNDPSRPSLKWQWLMEQHHKIPGKCLTCNSSNIQVKLLAIKGAETTNEEEAYTAIITCNECHKVSRHIVRYCCIQHNDYSMYTKEWYNRSEELYKYFPDDFIVGVYKFQTTDKNWHSYTNTTMCADCGNAMCWFRTTNWYFQNY